jgi:ribosome biogenesis GTPase A
VKRVPIKELMKSSNMVLEVLDARNVEGTRLPRFELEAGKRLFRIANKADLASKEIIARLVMNNFVLMYSKAKNLKKEREKLLNAILAHTDKRPLKIFVVGYPNVGKSTIINLLAGKKVARAGPVAGTTSNVQWVRIAEDVLVIDSPGVFPIMESKDSLIKKGAMNVNSLKDVEVHAFKLAQKCITDLVLRKWLSKYFDISIDEKDTPEILLEKIARRRNWLMKGGELNRLEAAKALLRALSQAPK